MKIETILSPAELPALARRDLRQTACVVFDILRATSTFVTALHLGAKRSGTGVPPVCFGSHGWDARATTARRCQ